MTLSLITHLVQSYGYYAVFTLIALGAYGWPSATDVTSAWTARNSRSGAICSPGMA